LIFVKLLLKLLLKDCLRDAEPGLELGEVPFLPLVARILNEGLLSVSKLYE
jgi:hypothetical protein